MAARLWTAPVTREAVVAAAGNVGRASDPTSLGDVARVTGELTQLTIPLGWVGGVPGGFGWWLGHLVGWALTGLLVMVGAPFWFDLLSRLISFRGASGGEPPRADQDPAAATPRVLARDANPAFIASILTATGGAPGAPDAVTVSVPESQVLQNIKRAVGMAPFTTPATPTTAAMPTTPAPPAPRAAP